MLKSGIYEIRNTQNNKTYIGSSVDTAKRFREHQSRLRRGDHINNHIQRAWNKYGENTFQFRVLLRCHDEDLLVLEQTIMDANHPEYNIALVAGNTLGVSKSDETRRKISATRKERNIIPWNKGKKYSAPYISEAMRGGKLSDEHKKNIGKAMKGRVFSDEHRKRLSDAAKRYHRNKKGRFT